MSKETAELAHRARKALTPPTGYRLAKAAEVDTDTAYAWLNGTREPRGGNILKLVKIATGKALGAAAIVITAALPSLFSGDTNAAQDMSAGPEKNPTVYYVKYLL
jgi:hypothetical protein